MMKDPQVRFIFAAGEPKSKLRAHITREGHRKTRLLRVQQYQEARRNVLTYRPSKRRVSFRRTPSPPAFVDSVKCSRERISSKDDLVLICFDERSHCPAKFYF